MDDIPLSKARLGRIMGAACRTDHVPFVTHCISMAQRADSQVTVQEVLQEALKRSANHAAMKCLHYVLELGANVHQLSPHWLVSTEGTSASMREVLEILVAHGYDINSEGDGLPVLWHVGVGDYDFVKWCLDQGADVDPPEQSPRTPLLEQAAVAGDIDTFELLRSKGAPFDRKFGVFPKAVMVANDCASDALDSVPASSRRYACSNTCWTSLGAMSIPGLTGHTTILVVCAALRSAGSHAIQGAPMRKNSSRSYLIMAVIWTSLSNTPTQTTRLWSCKALAKQQTNVHGHRSTIHLSGKPFTSGRTDVVAILRPSGEAAEDVEGCRHEPTVVLLMYF
jgi:hypothetical protein